MPVFAVSKSETKWSMEIEIEIEIETLDGAAGSSSCW